MGKGDGGWDEDRMEDDIKKYIEGGNKRKRCDINREYGGGKNGLRNDWEEFI